MKKYFWILVLILMSKTTFCQDIIISGINNNRLLTWDDFAGDPDRSSPHDANTYWHLSYSYQGLGFKGDTANIRTFSFTLRLNEKLSWVKKANKTDHLLKHEQGHFDIGLLCQRELISQFNNTVFLKADLNNNIQKLFNTILDKYRLMGVRYDQETGHSKEQAIQENWNTFFAKELNR